MKITNYKGKLVGYLLLFLSFLLTISIVRGYFKVNNTKKQIEIKKQEIIKLEAKNEELRQKIAYTKTDFYIEKEIRNKLGLGKSGEVVVVLPEPEIVKSFSPKLDESSNTKIDPNWKKWLKLFM